MDYPRLQFDFQHSIGLKLLRSKNAPMIFGFLYAQFKLSQRLSLPMPELVSQLENFLEDKSEEYPKAATAYLKDWADEEHRIIRIIRREQADLVELTADTERCITWLESLYQHQFVGTESRFLSMFDLLEQIVSKSTEDVATRVWQLEQEKKKIQAEIDLILERNAVEAFSETQLRERFWQASDLAKGLLSDFAAIEENFRGIARTVQERQLEPDSRKGSLLGFVLDADQQLRDSMQGRSFYAFWNFLSSENKRTELRVLLEQVYALPVLRDVVDEQVVLKRIIRYLGDAGSKVVASNQRLAEQLRRLLDEQNLSERRRVRQLLLEIKQLALYAPEEAFWLELDGDPEISLPLEKGLWEASTVQRLRIVPTTADVLDFSNPVFASLYQQFWVNEDQLGQQIAQLLESRSSCTLEDVLEVFPLKQGLSEILGYLTLAGREKQHILDSSQSVVLELDRQQWRVPLMTFRSADASR